MQVSTTRILTTHCGSLPRPKELLDLIKARITGQPYDPAAYDASVRAAVADVVKQQAESGIDVLTDGEQSKPGFYAYVRERMGGFEARPGSRRGVFEAEVEAFPEYYEQYFSRAMLGATLVPMVPFVCTAPISYKGQEAVARDIDNLKAALDGATPADVFMPAVAPSGVGKNEYYRDDEEFLNAVSEALRSEYQAIVDAGFIVQIDDPFLTELYSYSSLSAAQKRKTAEMYVEALNHGLRGIPPEKVRYHTCYGINEGPRVHDAPLKDIVDLVLKVNAGAYSFEAANPRHEHEYHVWETVKLSDGKAIIPGVITHASNIVEHPEYIAERIVRYAKLVGRENVIAGADCGFSSQATYTPEIHPTVMWAKFRALAEGATLASRHLGYRQ
jgi:5-methyltetrahydropteroyltriglutamate--homocysteine methyltransferase